MFTTCLVSGQFDTVYKVGTFRRLISATISLFPVGALRAHGSTLTVRLSLTFSLWCNLAGAILC